MDGSFQALEKTPESHNRIRFRKPSDKYHKSFFDIPSQPAGNLATQRLLRSSAMRPKLEISQPNHPYEQETDHAAAHVLKRLTPPSAIAGKAHEALTDTDDSALRTFTYPHADQIRQALGLSAPLCGVVDPAACARRNVPAFTIDRTTYFANAASDLHVATHEAVHQLQHEGLTGDANLGSEGHASVVADVVAAGRSAAPLIGPRGARVPAAERHYVYTTEYGPNGRLGDLGETLTFSNKEAYALPSLIQQADGILKARRSGISLAPGPQSKSVKVPDGSNKANTLARLLVTMNADPKEDKFFGDCRQAAEEVMGGKGLRTSDSAVINVGGSEVLVGQPDNDKVNDIVAKVFFVHQEIAKHPNYQSLPEEEKQKILKTAAQDYEDLTVLEKTKLRNKAAESSKAKELGMDRYASPAVGEAFALIPKDRPAPGKFQFHFAAVIMAPGPDRVTFENAGAARDEKTDNWLINTYGQASGQTFQEEWARVFKGDVNTLVIRNQPRAPADIGMTVQKPTAELMDLYVKSTSADERYYIKQELDQRQVSGSVEVQKEEDWIGNDEVFLQSGSARSSKVQIPQGQSRILTMAVGTLLPVSDPLIVYVYEYDLLDPNDLIGTVRWPAPYLPKTVTVTGDGARYVVTLSL